MNASSCVIDVWGMKHPLRSPQTTIVRLPIVSVRIIPVSVPGSLCNIPGFMGVCPTTISPCEDRVEGGCAVQLDVQVINSCSRGKTEEDE